MFYKTILRRNTKNGPKLKVATACSNKLSLGQFSPGTRASYSLDRNLLPAQTPLTDPRVWNRIDLQSDEILKTQPINQQGTTNNSNGKFHLLQRKTNFPTTTTKNERREARLKLIPGEISSIKFSWSSFPVTHAGLETRSCNRSQRAGGGLVGVSWCGVTRDWLRVTRSWCFRAGRLRFDRGKFARCFLCIDISV